MILVYFLMKFIIKAAIRRVMTGAKFSLTPIIPASNVEAPSLRSVRKSIEFTNTLVASATAVPMNRPTKIIRITSFQGLVKLLAEMLLLFAVFEI